MDTDSLHTALSEEKLDKIIRLKMQPLWYWIRQSDCAENFAANSSTKLFPREFCNKHVAFDRRTPGIFKKEFWCSETIVYAQKFTTVTMNNQIPIQ